VTEHRVRPVDLPRAVADLEGIGTRCLDNLVQIDGNLESGSGAFTGLGLQHIQLVLLDCELP
jgi:hypothetical protein